MVVPNSVPLLCKHNNIVLTSLIFNAQESLDKNKIDTPDPHDLTSINQNIMYLSIYILFSKES